MTTTMLPGAVPGGVASLRPVASADDSFAADEILMLWIGDEPRKIQEVVPGGKTFNAVEIAEDGSYAIFDVYASGDWNAMDEKPIKRIIVPRTATL